MNVGDVVGNYRITEVLGEGGMGVVYLGTHTLIGREAAIKVLLPSLSNKQDVVQRFFNEAKTTSSIKHPGIVEVFDFGYSEQGHAFIVMERLEGETLEHRIRRLGRLPAEKALALFSQLARALGGAHGLGVIHRDLKPANIYIVSDPDVSGGERAKILDFGIAKLRNAGNVGVRTASGQLMGAPDYMAPEQCLGASEVDPRADLYAVGCMLFHAVTGKPPFVGDSFADVLAAHVSKPVPRASASAPVPGPLDDVIYKLMSKAPEERPQSTDELLQLLSAAIGGKPSQGAPPLPRSKAQSAPPPIPAASRRTVMAASQPPPVPTAAGMGSPGDLSLPPEVLDSRAPLPPLPQAKAAPFAKPPSTTAPPPIPRAPANARTLYTDASGVPAAPNSPAPPRGPVAGVGPLNDPRLAKTMAPQGPMAGNPMLSVPGPSAHRTPPPPAMTAPQAPVARPNRAAPGARTVSPLVTAQGVGAPTVASGPRKTQAIGQPAAVYPTRQPDASRPVARPEYPVEMGPRRGHNVRPMPPQRAEGGGSWKVIVGVLLIVGASAGGFFIYKSATRKAPKASNGAPVASASGGSDAGTTVATSGSSDAAAAVVAVDASATVATTLDASLASDATDASAMAAGATPDAAVVATIAIDAAPVAAAAIDAAPKVVVKPVDAAPQTVTASSGRVLDPDLKSAVGGDDGVQTVTLIIETRPAGALVIRKHDNLTLGKTPMEYVTRKFNANENFEVKLGGYFGVSFKMSTFRNGKRLLPLLARPK